MVKDLIRQGEKLFEKRLPLMSLWQELADHFYVERADFTVTRGIGTDFARHLTNSYPLLARRDLGSTLSAMLRPSQTEWFRMVANQETGHRGKVWLERATKIMRNAMYDRAAQFVKATKQGDHDFATFGQCVIETLLNHDTMTLLYRTWHLRDVAWCEGIDGSVDTVFRRWQPEARVLGKLFPGKLHQRTMEKIAKDPYAEVKCMHIVVPAEQYEKLNPRAKFASIYVDCENEHVIEKTGVLSMPYTIPRWQTVSGSQYAHSPATVCALPDARLLQAMTLTLLEAGEKAVNPPMIGVGEALRSDLQLFAGGFTSVDAAYDERLGDVLRPLNIDKSGLQFGHEMHQQQREMIAQAFYLNKLTLPMMTGDMTATEVSQRVQEYIRQAAPLFEPMEYEYNAALCERTFDLMMGVGAFGPMDEIPDELAGADIQFKFQSPLQEADEKKKAQTYMEGRALLAAAAELDPSAVHFVDSRVALREALLGTGMPASWLRDEDEIDGLIQADAARAQQQAVMAQLAGGAQVAEQFGRASKALA